MNKDIKFTVSEVNEIEVVLGRLLLETGHDLDGTVIGARAENVITILRKKLAHAVK